MSQRDLRSLSVSETATLYTDLVKKIHTGSSSKHNTRVCSSLNTVGFYSYMPLETGSY